MIKPVYGVSPLTEAIISGRMTFSKKYCAEKGWNIDDLSIEQILEIREQEGWKVPVPDGAKDYGPTKGLA